MNIIKLTTLLLILSVLQTSKCLNNSQIEGLSKDAHCYALAIEGGGDAGAWEVGALKSLYAKYSSGYQVISGVSIGSINGVYIASYKREDQKEGISQLYNDWSVLHQKDIYKPANMFNLLYNLYYKSGLYDNSPELELLHKYFDNRTIQILISIGVTDFTEGVNKVFDLDKENDTERIIKLVKSSTSAPVLFQNMKMDNHTYVDGGVLQNLDIGSIVRRCKELGYEQKDIIVDILLSSRTQMEEDDNQNYSVIESLLRYIKIQRYISANDDLLHALWNYQQLKVRHVLAPIKPLASKTHFAFKNDQMVSMLKQGEQEAKQIIDNDVGAQRQSSSYQQNQSAWL